MVNSDVIIVLFHLRCLVVLQFIMYVIDSSLKVVKVPQT